MYTHVSFTLRKHSYTFKILFLHLSQIILQSYLIFIGSYKEFHNYYDIITMKNEILTDRDFVKLLFRLFELV